MLGESPDSRRAIFADLRRVYDRSFERELAGRKIGWNGTLGLLGACTEAIEDHRDELATLGERLVYYRMPRLDPSGRAAVLSRARANVGQQQAMRTKLAEAAAGFLTGMSVPNEPPALDDTIARWIEHLADTSATFRSPVQRGGHHSDEITLVPEPEVPTRVVAVLTQLWRGLEVIGVDDSEARRLIHHVAIGGVPTLRRRVFVLLSQKSIAVTTAHVAGMLGLPRTTVRRHLQDLAALGLLEGRDNFQNEERWSVPAEVARRWPLVGQPEEFVHGVEAPRLLDLDGSQRAHVAAEFGVSLDGEDPP